MSGPALGMNATCPICRKLIPTPAKLVRRTSPDSAVVVVDTSTVREHMSMHTEPLREAARILEDADLS